MGKYWHWLNDPDRKSFCFPYCVIPWCFVLEKATLCAYSSHTSHISPSLFFQTFPQWKAVCKSDITTSSPSLWPTWPKSLTTAATTTPMTRPSFSVPRCSKASLYRSLNVSKRAGKVWSSYNCKLFLSPFPCLRVCAVKLWLWSHWRIKKVLSYQFYLFFS